MPSNTPAPAVRGAVDGGALTLCNLSIEGGARFGMVAPDAVTFDYLKGRPFAPSGADWDARSRHWSALPPTRTPPSTARSTLDAAEIAPVVTWGTSPRGRAADHRDRARPGAAPESRKPPHALRAALDYMGLVPGRRSTGTPVDQVFIGSCTNARIEDLRAAAAVLAGRRARVPGLVSPGSRLVKAQAEAEGLDRIFTEAGLDWVASGCSMCVGMNGDIVAPGKRCASTTNRNFRGRQGRGARTHLMSPAMVAAAAVTGTLTDVRPFLEGRKAA
jgi:3-isopropylmalate/(R)-2-methylmalate dehydratase large subunit